MAPDDVGPGAVGGHRGVEQDRQLGADRPDVAGRAEALLDLVGAGGAEGLAERVLELDLVDAVVAADDHQLHGALVDDHREGLERGAGGDPERADERLDRRRARRLHELGSARVAGGSSTGWASAEATSMLAA